VWIAFELADSTILYWVNHHIIKKNYARKKILVTIKFFLYINFFLIWSIAYRGSKMQSILIVNYAWTSEQDIYLAK
jgi:hypothetical protein